MKAGDAGYGKGENHNEWIMRTGKIEETVRADSRKGIFHLFYENGKPKRYRPWLGDIFSFLYDRSMDKTVFPRKFSASLEKHYEILANELGDVHHQNILELACGTGDAVRFLHNDNIYTGVDISQGLLKIAFKKLTRYGFSGHELYVADACDLPFRDHIFDTGICNLSLNFFPDIDRFIAELKRVLKQGASFYCSVPVPEKKKPGVTIRGILYSAGELKKRFEMLNFIFEELPWENGALLYFKCRTTG
jgi:SAM-dependent methyltransferase